MVFDVTDPKSFLNIKKWLNNIQEVINRWSRYILKLINHLFDLTIKKNADEKVLKLLIGNKIDMVDIRVINKESAKEVWFFLQFCIKI